MNKRKKMISLAGATPYQLGIIFGCGSIVDSEKEKTFVIRHRDKYFLEQLENIILNGIGHREYEGKRYYVLKTNMIDYNELEMINYCTRNSDIRNIPYLNNYCDFFRAYIELHGCWDYCTSYKRNKEKYYRLRFRLYGNIEIINNINSIFEEKLKIKIKSPQLSDNNKTAYIAYTSLSEISSIVDYVKGNPYNKYYWQDVNDKIKNPRKWRI